ncbi:MAG TPA: dTDP-4-dehydrorhamnose reductase [Clostridia bacterium]|nr:dTDP-4-dehydrorhamnose reductase [Clostridia bacterium]
MRIFITAGNGQLGTDATAYFSKNHDVISYKDVDLDVTDREKMFRAVGEAKPDVLINCAAITNVDGCESNEELAYRVNADGALITAEAAKAAGAKIVHISTDYVFDGTRKGAYRETDPTCPNNVYGRSKLAGELNVAKACPEHYILRTAWLYGPNGNNFLKTMMKIGAEKGAVSVVTDQVGNPTSTFELIRIIDAVIKTDRYGVYHATCEGCCSWNEFAREIFSMAGMNVKVSDITSEQLVRPAPRPANSNLCKDKLFQNCGYRPTQWKASLKEYFEYTAK